MKTNNFFEFDRFVRLLKQDLLFNYKFYLVFVSGLSLGIYLFSSLIIRYSNSYFIGSLTKQFYSTLSNYLFINNAGHSITFLSAYYLLYNLVLFITFVFIGMSFPSFGNQRSTSNYLLIPGSTFEKMLVQFVVRFVLFIPLVMLLLRVCVYLAIASMVPDPKTGFDPLFVDEFSYITLFLSSGGLINNPLRDLAYLFTAFAGAAYFKSYAVVKTQLALILISLALPFCFLLTGDRDWYKSGLDFLGGSKFYFALSPVSIGFFLLSLPWAYYKLKEKEL